MLVHKNVECFLILKKDKKPGLPSKNLKKLSNAVEVLCLINEPEFKITATGVIQTKHQDYETCREVKRLTQREQYETFWQA
jgi:hypothetical protein